MIASHINYRILAWGSNLTRIEKLPKKAIRIITCSKYNSHTEPLLKELNLLKAADTFKLSKLKFYHKFLNNKQPNYLQNLPLTTNNNIHNHNTRHSQSIHVVRVSHAFAKKSIRWDIPITVNALPSLIKDKLNTHSLNGFATYTKNYILSKYSYSCNIQNCYICNKHQTDTNVTWIAITTILLYCSVNSLKQQKYHSAPRPATAPSKC